MGSGLGFAIQAEGQARGAANIPVYAKTGADVIKLASKSFLEQRNKQIEADKKLREEEISAYKALSDDLNTGSKGFVGGFADKYNEGYSEHFQELEAIYDSDLSDVDRAKAIAQLDTKVKIKENELRESQAKLQQYYNDIEEYDDESVKIISNAMKEGVVDFDPESVSKKISNLQSYKLKKNIQTSITPEGGVNYNDIRGQVDRLQNENPGSVEEHYNYVMKGKYELTPIVARNSADMIFSELELLDSEEHRAFVKRAGSTRDGIPTDKNFYKDLKQYIDVNIQDEYDNDRLTDILREGVKDQQTSFYMNEAVAATQRKINSAKNTQRLRAEADEESRRIADKTRRPLDREIRAANIEDEARSIVQRGTDSINIKVFDDDESIDFNLGNWYSLGIKTTPMKLVPKKRELPEEFKGFAGLDLTGQVVELGIDQETGEAKALYRLNLAKLPNLQEKLEDEDFRIAVKKQVEPGFFSKLFSLDSPTEEEIQALFAEEGEEYQLITIPLNIKESDFGAYQDRLSKDNIDRLKALKKRVKSSPNQGTVIQTEQPITTGSDIPAAFK